MTDHLEAWHAYAEARLQRDQTSSVAKEAEKKFRIAEGQLVDAMLEDNVDGWKDACGASIIMRESFNICVNQANAIDVERWLREKFGDSEPYKTIVIDKWAVRDRCKSLVEDEGVLIEELPEFLEANKRLGIAVTDWPAKAQEIAELS